MKNVGIWLAMLCCTGCGSGERPTQTFALAAQGFHTGALSNDGSMALVGSLNHGASLWRTNDHERLFNWSHEQGKYAALVATSFSPDGSHAVTSDARTLVLWDTRTGRGLKYWTTPGAVLDAVLFDDNRHVLLGLDDNSALVFDAQTGDYTQTLLHQGKVGAVALSGNGERALTGSDDSTAVLWNLASGTPIQRYQHDNPIRAVALSSSGRYAFTAAQGDLVALWDNQTGQKIHELHNGINHGVLSARFSADELRLAVGYTNRKVVLYEVSSAHVINTWDSGTRHRLRATGAAVLEVAFSADARVLWALTGDGRLLKLTAS